MSAEISLWKKNELNNKMVSVRDSVYKQRKAHKKKKVENFYI